MDSGNSGSMQSSSGGDEEYDSRGESISTFLNNNSNNPNSLTHFGSISYHKHNDNNPPFLSHHHQQQHPNNTFFDTTAPSLFPQSSNPQFNTNDLIWSSSSSRALRSDHNFSNFAASSSGPLSSSSNAAAAAQLFHYNQSPFSSGSSSSLPTMQQTDTVRAANVAQPDHQPNVAKNPKKRTRASRRAPTTVLTTDTTNFRQMVQEFTGIPTAPFTGSPYTRRLDLFSTGGSSMRTSHLDSLGPLYPLRPSAQKVQASPFILSSSATASSSSSLLGSSMIDALMPTNNNTGTNNNNNNNTILGTISTASASASTSITSTNFQLGSSHLGIQKQAQNLFNMQNQILSFNSGAQGGGISNTINVPSLDELGLSHDQQVSANLISGFQGGNNTSNISSQARNDGNNLSRLWRNNHDGGRENQRLRSFDANSNNNNNNGVGGLNCSGNSSTSEFHTDQIKGLENVCSTGEGPVSSWPCPSD